MNKDFSSQECPRCFNVTGKKKLSERVHRCPHCGFEQNRDIVSAIILEQRGERAVGLPVRKLPLEGM